MLFILFSVPHFSVDNIAQLELLLVMRVME